MTSRCYISMYISWTQKTQDASGSEDENADVSAATLDSVTCLQCTRTRDAPSKFVEVRGSSWKLCHQGSSLSHSCFAAPVDDRC